MHISQVELENIKSHASSVFKFSKGTTAITGENGAGKTTIIEAVAWVLFDVLDYKKEDFLRRGAKKGSVRITFESSLDEREYVVTRDTAAGYHVTDPRLRTRVADKKDEVVRFLWQHTGLEPGTDLRSLFRQAIGVPQGTFTAVFLDGAAERKVAFDKLLKVEEYRQAAEKLLDTSRFIDVSAVTVRESIARAEGELARAPAVDEEHKNISEHAAKLAGSIDAIVSDLAEKRARITHLEEQEKLVSSLKTALERSRSEKEKAEIVASQAERAVKRASDAAEKLAAARSGHEKHVETLGRLKELEREREMRDKLRTQLAKTEAAIVKVRSEQGVLDRDLAKIQSSRQEIEALRSKAEQQHTLEKEIDGLKDRIAAALSSDERIVSIEAELGRLRTKYTKTKSDLSTAIKNAEQAAAKSYNDRKTEIEIEGDELNDKKEFLKKRQLGLPDLERQMSAAKEQLGKLADPAARIRVLEKETAREAEIRRGLSDVESNLERLETERKATEEQLDGFKALDANWSQLTVERDSSAADHRTFLANEADAASFETRREEFVGATGALTAVIERAAAAEREFAAAGVDYDAELHRVERAALLDAERRHAEISATLDAAKGREAQLAAELARFAELRKSLAGEFREKERLEEIGEATSFIRDTLKEAAPRVARNYVHHVSLEANQMFREITGDAMRTLKWGEDYAVTLEEDGYERPFQSLSGGEQMAAALSIRLALLKQLSDIRIAFFDEPTTNLDAERRENFSLEISRIKHFDQLFVISHDETFDSYVDHVVSV